MNNTVNYKFTIVRREMLNSSINLSNIRVFVLIAELGSFTKAAEFLQCSRSNLSKHLSQLESDLKIKLFIRTTRSQRLTTAGETFYHKCKTALSEIDQAVALLKDDSDLLAGKININCVGGIIGEQVITDIISKFSQLYPNITINLDFSSVRVDLVSDEFDLIFRMGELQDSGFIGRKLTELSIETLASPGYIKLAGKISHPKDLQHQNCLTGSVKSWSFQSITSPKTKLDIHVDGNFSCKNGRSLLNSAVKGVGVVRLPALYCADEIAQGQLVPVLNDWHINPVPLYLMYAKDDFQPTRLKTLIEFIITEFN